MILNDEEINRLCCMPPEGRPLIEPYNLLQVEPASYDMLLGNYFKIFQRDSTTHIDLVDPADITKDVYVEDGDGMVLHPGEFILGVTKEKVNMPVDLVGRIEGKSSIGRLGIQVHVTAGYIDPGFRGNVTLEMTSHHPLPIILRPGLKIAQMSFHMMTGPALKPYQGRYQGDNTVVSSRYDGTV